MPTEAQLVEDLGVSRKTVRAALSQLEQQGILVAQRGRGRVVAGDINARPGMLTKAVVVLTALPDAKSNPYLLKAASDKVVETAAVSAIEMAGLHTFVLNPRGLSLSAMDDLVRERPYGVLAAHGVADLSEGPDILHYLQKQGIPVVAHGDAEGLADVDRVAADQYGGGLQLVQWLIDHGARRILRVRADARPTYWRIARDRAYEDAIRRAGLECLPPLLLQGYQRRSLSPNEANFRGRARLMAGYLLEHLSGDAKIDAILLPTDLDVHPAAAACRLLGKRPGEEVEIVGFDNLWQNCWEREFEDYVPPVTVEKHDGRTGSAMVDLLTRRIAGQLAEAPQRVLVETELISVATSG